MLWSFLMVIVLLVLIYLKLMKTYNHWYERGVKQIPAQYNAIENGKMLMRICKPFTEIMTDIYNEFPESRYSGGYQMSLPILLIKDLDLIKQIMVKDFDYFQNHRAFIDPDSDPIWGNTLLGLTDEKWKEMRSTLSPAFTSSKMKYMFKLIEENAKQFVKHFVNKKENMIVAEMKGVYSKFSNDIIATTAFGVECDSLNNPNNEFYLAGKQIANFSTIWRNLKLLGYTFMPGIFKYFKIPLLNENETRLFVDLMKRTIQVREKHNIIRPDMLNILLQAKHNGSKYDELLETYQSETLEETNQTKKYDINDSLITSLALSFFFSGFDSISTVMCFTSYELATNPNVQIKLQKEIDETHKVCGDNELTYEVLTQMKYLDMVISENLRKWPIAIATDRVCTKPYTIQPNGPDERPLTLNKNDSVWIPINSLQHDPKYFPDPEKFDPERFSEENRHKFKQYAYLPFGTGPRGCLGAKLAVLEAKVLFYHLLYYFEIVPVEKTPIPMVLSNKQFTVVSKNGYWLGLKRRQPIH